MVFRFRRISMMPKKTRKRTPSLRKPSSRAVRVLLPPEIYDLYRQVALDQHISITQVVSRVAIEFVNIEKEASDSRRSVLDANRFERLESLRAGREYLLDTKALAAPAAALYAEIFTQLFAFDSAKLSSFFSHSTEDTSLINERGFVFVAASGPECRVYECYTENDAAASFHSGEGPADVECRSGSLRLLFSGKQFSGIPVLVEFAPGQRFAVPPLADCTLSLRRATTMLLRSYDSSGSYENAPADFEKIASLVSDLAKREALESLPGLETKGLIIKLDSLV
jgi:hypothetical protein